MRNERFYCDNGRCRRKKVCFQHQIELLWLFFSKKLPAIVDCWRIKYDDVEEQLHTSSSIILLCTQTINQVLESFRPFSTIHKVTLSQLGMQLRHVALCILRTRIQLYGFYCSGTAVTRYSPWSKVPLHAIAVVLKWPIVPIAWSNLPKEGWHPYVNFYVRVTPFFQTDLCMLYVIHHGEDQGTPSLSKALMYHRAPYIIMFRSWLSDVIQSPRRNIISVKTGPVDCYIRSTAFSWT